MRTLADLLAEHVEADVPGTPRRDEPARALVRKLRQRPGRGGVRLSYEEAELALALITAGAAAIARERARR